MKYFTFIFFFFAINISQANESELNNFFDLLKKAPDMQSAKVYEKEIWDYWISNGSSDKANETMRQGLKLMNEGNLKSALRTFSDLSKEDPQWAETWNKVATVRYLLGDLYGSLRDIQATLLLEPRHFGAIAGLTQINIALGRYKEALQSLDQAILIYPYISIKSLRPMIEDMISKSEV